MWEAYDQKSKKIHALRTATRAMLRERAKLDGDDEIGIIAFHGKAYVACPPIPVGPNLQRLVGACDDLEKGDNTVIHRGLAQTEQVMPWDRADIVRRITLLSDGHGGHASDVAKRLKDRGVVIECIGIGSSPSMVDEKILREIASELHGETQYRFLQDSETLIEHFTTNLATKTQIE